MIFLTNPPELPDGGPANLVAGPVTVRDAEGKEHEAKVLLPGESVRDRIFAAALGGCAAEAMRLHTAIIQNLPPCDDPEGQAQSASDELDALVITAVGVANRITNHAMQVRRANIEAMVEQMKPKGDNHKDKNESRIIRPGQEGQT